MNAVPCESVLLLKFFSNGAKHWLSLRVSKGRKMETIYRYYRNNPDFRFATFYKKPIGFVKGDSLSGAVKYWYFDKHSARASK